MNGKTILLVDDSDLVAGMIGEALGEEGFDVIRAHDGYEAIELTYKHIPDIIVMDIDMPLLKGYQASRLLKTRRGVKDIPIIMHTANTEDKDRFWSYNSGACAFVVKDYEHIGPLVETAKRFIAHEAPDVTAIQEDAKNITRETISEAMSNLLDTELFKSTIMNELAKAGRSLSSLSGTVLRVLELLDLACERHVACLILRNGRDVTPYVYPMEMVNKEMADDLLSVSLQDFFGIFDRNTLKISDTVFFNVDNRSDWNKVKLDKSQLCSYYFCEIKGSGGDPIATLHIANLKNNYFSEPIVRNVSAFAHEAGVIVQNAILFKQVATMEREIRNVFSKFVPPEIINDLVTRKTSAAMLSGEKREVVILFSDIRSFTTISEANAPEKVVSFLNNYLERMCDIIQGYGGTIDKFIGDAILAVFGAPTSYPDNAERAVKSALAMSQALRDFNTGGFVLPPEGMDIGIGIHKGDAIVGNIGSNTKFDYTVIGDTVNLASRLEGLTKQYHCRILVSGEVARDIQAMKKDHPTYAFREIEQVIVKGKGLPTQLLKVDDLTVNPFNAEDLDSYQKGLAMYRLKNWNTAKGYFEKLISSKPDDSLGQMFLKRCEEYEKTPPPADWDLIQRIISK